MTYYDKPGGGRSSAGDERMEINSFACKEPRPNALPEIGSVG